MRRVAVITDIHTNLPALEATLAQIERRCVDAVTAAATSSVMGRIRTRSERAALQAA
jgi:hypothetical protein